MKSLSTSEIDRMQLTINAAVDALRKIADLAELYGSGLAEVRAMRHAVKNGVAPGDLNEFIGFVAEHEPALAECLRGADLERFDMGRLWLEVSDGISRNMLEMRRGTLTELLKQHYGTSFAIRIRAPRPASPEF